MANEDLNIAKNAINNARGKMINSVFKRDRTNIVSSVAAEVARMFKPFLKEIRETARVDKTELLNALSQITVEGTPSHVTVPEIKIPEINVPEPRAHVTVPPIRVPDVIMPDEMNVRGFVSLMGVDLGNPLPVQLRDKDGNPVNLIENITSISGGGSGGGSKIVKISDIRASSASLIDQVDGALKVVGSLSATLSADTGSGEIGSDTLRVVQATNAISSVNIVSGASSGTQYDDGDTADPSTGTVSMGDTGEESSNIYSLAIAEGATGSNTLRVAHATDSVASVVVNSGSLTSVTTVTGITNSVAVMIQDGDGNTRTTFPIEGTLTGITNDVSIDDGGNSITVDGTVAVSGVTNSIAASIIDSSGVQYSTSNPVPIDDAGGSLTVDGSVVVTSVTASTTAIIGDKRADEADGDSNPVKIGGVARTANPTAVAAGDRVSATYDDIGRQVVRPVQVRDLLQTAYVTASSEGPKTLLAGSSGVFHDLVYLMGANESDAAITLDITQSTSGTVQGTLRIPADSTAGLALGGATIPQDHADATWQVDNNASDHSNTTYAVTALFSKEV